MQKYFVVDDSFFSLIKDGVYLFLPSHSHYLFKFFNYLTVEELLYVSLKARVSFQNGCFRPHFP